MKIPWTKQDGVEQGSTGRWWAYSMRERERERVRSWWRGAES